MWPFTSSTPVSPEDQAKFDALKQKTFDDIEASSDIFTRAGKMGREDPLGAAEMSNIPGISDMASAILAGKALKEGNKGEAALHGLGAIPLIPALHTAYHGSPHKFDKFDLGKVGTGEGAQVYGHGTYLAEADDVARTYIPKGPEIVKVDGEIYNPQNAYHRASKELAEDFKFDRGAASADFDRLSKEGHFPKPGKVFRGPLQELYQNVSDILGSDAPLGKVERGREKNGYLYKVDIPDELIPKMLDWDKPVSEQSELVKRAYAATRMPNKELKMERDYLSSLRPSSLSLAKKMISSKDARIGTDAAMDNWDRLYNLSPKLDHNAIHDIARAYDENVGSWYRTADNDPASMAARLEKLGIPGIRYWDGESRGLGEGTSNFVIFDPSVVKILERNGIPLTQDIAEAMK